MLVSQCRSWPRRTETPLLLWAQGLYMASPGVPTAVCGKDPGPSTNLPAPQVSEDAPKCFHLPGSFFPMFPQNLSARVLPTSQKKLGGGSQVAMWLPARTNAANSPYLCERWRQPRPWSPCGELCPFLGTIQGQGLEVVDPQSVFVGMKKQKDRWRMDECTCGWVDGEVGGEWLDGCVYVQVSEWMGTWVGTWVNKLGWMNMCVGW